MGLHAILYEEDAEWQGFVETVIQHEAVTKFKDVNQKRHAWKKHGIKRKDRYLLYHGFFKLSQKPRSGFWPESISTKPAGEAKGWSSQAIFEIVCRCYWRASGPAEECAGNRSVRKSIMD
jgi:hypothetical protein